MSRRLATAGFKASFVREAILPDWWDAKCEEDPALLQEVEIRVARFLGVPASEVAEVGKPLRIFDFPGVQLKHSKNLEASRLRAAIHAGTQLAMAVVRNLRNADHPVEPIPTSPLAWRSLLSPHASSPPDLGVIVSDLWRRGVPVVHAGLLPQPKFQGMACIVAGRPVIVLGHGYDQPARLAAHLAHEAGHIAHGDCTPDRPVVEVEGDDEPDSSDIELRADAYAWTALMGVSDPPTIEAGDFRTLAERADETGQQMGIDAGILIWSWASRTRDYGMATQALTALWSSSGAKATVRRSFDLNVDVEGASESDRRILRCVFGDPERDAAD